MKQKRLVWLFGTFLAAFAVVTARLYLLAANTELASTAKAQTVTEIKLGKPRGNIYDCHGSSLTGGSLRYFALSVPGESSYAALFQYVPYKSQALLYEKRNSLTPFLIEVDRDLTDQGIYTYAIPERYPAYPLAPHLVGYVNAEGSGVAGLEAAFDETLNQSAEGNYIRCVTTARGTLMKGEEPNLITHVQSTGGLVLTLDKAMQRACEGVAAKQMERGCILVLDTKTAKVRASVSMPRFDPDAVYKSIEAKDTSLLNRPLCQFNVGSVFKPILAAAALERGWDWYTHECEGYIDVKGQIYHCAENRAHETVNLKKALCKSCNCFFIDLGQKLGGDILVETAKRFGFGEPVYLGGGLKSAAGNLPDGQTLENLGQLANISFGQGQLMATPLQVAAAMNVIASDGQYRVPAFVEHTINEKTGAVEQELYKPRRKPAISEDTARQLRSMLQAVVEEGLGKDAAPEYGGAGGKTGTAQTGVINEDGKELMNYWFAGFYPAEQPRYTIVVMQDAAVNPRVSSGTIFANVCDALYWLDKPGKNS